MTKHFLWLNFFLTIVTTVTAVTTVKRKEKKFTFSVFLERVIGHIWQPMWFSQGSVLRFSRCFILMLLSLVQEEEEKIKKKKYVNSAYCDFADLGWNWNILVEFVNLFWFFVCLFWSWFILLVLVYLAWSWVSLINIVWT